MNVKPSELMKIAATLADIWERLDEELPEGKDDLDATADDEREKHIEVMDNITEAIRSIDTAAGVIRRKGY